MNESAICLLSVHEKDFWQADVYYGGWHEGAAPDWFCTGKLSGNRGDIIAKVRKVFPEILIEDAVDDDGYDDEVEVNE